eukprot:CAMPEP_0176461512 /NCGR_PEP_ID=MMETSP0127-20121128/34705_1 /TAXON_ID=938130 /ORGANISM="Platyophrya macrostoma, Strain WH" /LENGTH=152 /DNA_ID=CAMNT_0017853231 /DNA_START=43 /DNA_END=501 /DNA_ORIENTATION=-
MQTAVFISLLMLLASPAAAWGESPNFLDQRVILLDESEPYPFSYCSEKLPLTVDSLEVSAPPTKGKTTNVTISGTSTLNTTATTIMEIITLNGEKISNTTKNYTGAFHGNQSYIVNHALKVNDSSKSGTYNCKISIYDANQSLTCIQITYSL